jgi:ABC-type polysaccharide/polyol phosphate transport system ATPase subunit
MSDSAVIVDGLWKSFRLYQEKNQYLKSTLLRGKRARYEEFWALKDVSFEIPQGSTFGIIGTNGSGKSTLLKCLTGILSPDKGSVSINGDIAALLELGAGFHPDLSGRENIFLNGAILGMTNKQIEDRYEEIVEFSELGRFIDTPVKNYSSGMTVRLGFSIAINVEPEILIIDEVLAVGDENFQQKCREKIEDFRQRGKTIILVSHGLTDVANICDQVAWLDKGQLRAIGPAVEIVSKYNALSHQAEPVQQEDRGDRWGTREIEIQEVFLSDELGDKVTNVESGKLVNLNCSYQSSIELNNGAFAYGITDIHGNVLWGTNSKVQGVPFPIARGAGNNTVTIPNLHLLDGTYDLSVAVADGSYSHEYDHWSRRHRFTVRQETVKELGMIQMKSFWNPSQFK